ncbi:MAG: response regulator transcription factor [Psychromonas sp.]
MTHLKQVLVVDYDQGINALLIPYLSANSFDVLTASDRTEMEKQLAIHQPDVIILNVMLPGEDGFALCQHLQQTSNVPIIMLTENADEMDRVLELEMGVDDYIAKPFSPRALLVRMKRLLRRTHCDLQEIAERPAQVKNRYYCFAHWKLDTQRQVLVDCDQKVFPLTGSDFQLLMLFIESERKPLSRDQICQSLHGRDVFANERGIDVHLSRLRHCLGDNAKAPNIIKTVRGKGYLFIASAHKEE